VTEGENAKAADALALAEEIRERIKREKGIELEYEVELWRAESPAESSESSESGESKRASAAQAQDADGLKDSSASTDSLDSTDSTDSTDL
ncbi:MAG TPA: hypothetical protein VEV81_15410, partial [Pyrinomonadaceae bacterium]|nr:hypothetical protein [Pyrinomonadaceae bacterium]